MSIGTAGRGEVSEFKGDWVALIVPSSLIVQDPTKQWVSEADADEEHADGNRKDRSGLHGGLQNWGKNYVGGEAFRCAITPKVYFSFLGSTVYNLPP